MGGFRYMFLNLIIPHAVPVPYLRSIKYSWRPTDRLIGGVWGADAPPENEDSFVFLQCRDSTHVYLYTLFALFGRFGRITVDTLCLHNNTSKQRDLP